MTDTISEVANHYDEALAHESERLEVDAPVEFAMTARYLKRYVEPGSRVVDVGTGAGHYAELLAERECRLHLIDISEQLLEQAEERMSDAGYGDAVEAATVASATDLGFLDDGEFDAALLLGPLYHLPQRDERKTVVRETHRILADDGRVFAAGINRLAHLRDTFVNDPETLAEYGPFHRRFVRDGKVDEQRHEPPELRNSLCRAHLTTSDELRELLNSRFDEMLLAGVESFTGHNQRRFHDLSAQERETCLDLVEATAETQEGRGASEHFLYVGRAS